MKPKISVILPVYNAEKYLRYTLDSVLGGGFSDFEIVAVNDGSKDSSLAILEEYRERDARVKVIDKPNTGVSDTRNVGIAAAEGDYIAFLDADDIYSPDYLERMHSAAEACGADVTVCSYVTFRGDAPTFPTSENAEAKPTTIRELLDTGLMTPLWVKLVKKSVIVDNGIAFDKDLAFGEDLFFSWRACISAGKTVRLDDKLYGYRMSSEGATAKYHDRLYHKYKAAFESLKEYALGNNASEDAIREIDIHFVKRLPTLSFMCARSNQGIFKKRRYVKEILNDDVVRDISENHLDELVEGENKKAATLYRAAAKKRVSRVFLYGITLEYRLKLSRFKRKLEERQRDKK